MLNYISIHHTINNNITDQNIKNEEYKIISYEVIGNQ